jgi:hypothetical protein
MIHCGGLALKAEVGLDLSTGGRKSSLFLLSPNEFEDLLLACSEFSHRCSAEHCSLRNTARKERVKPVPKKQENHRTEDTQGTEEQKDYRITADQPPHAYVRVFVGTPRKLTSN